MKERLVDISFRVMMWVAWIMIPLIVVGCIISPCTEISVGNSSYPTFKEGDVSVGLYFPLNLERGDFVGIRKEDGKVVLKRIIGLPGETVEYKSGKVYINGEILENDFGTSIGVNGELTVLGPDEYYVLGDNRGDSLDSRHYGAVNRKNIFSKTLADKDKNPIIVGNKKETNVRLLALISKFYALRVLIPFS